MSLMRDPSLSRPHSEPRQQAEVVLFCLWSRREILCDRSRIARPLAAKLRRASKPTVLWTQLRVSELNKAKPSHLRNSFPQLRRWGFCHDVREKPSLNFSNTCTYHTQL